MRYSCDSARNRCSSADSARAEERSWPNGFSTTTRACSVSTFARARPSTTVANSDGGISR